MQVANPTLAIVFIHSMTMITQWSMAVAVTIAIGMQMSGSPMCLSAMIIGLPQYITNQLDSYVVVLHYRRFDVI